MWTIFEVFIDSFFLFFCNIVPISFSFLAKRHMGSQLPDQGLNPHHLHWKVKS